MRRSLQRLNRESEMADYDNSNRFAIWGNKKQREGKQDADFNGNLNCVCPKCGQPTDYWVDAWKRKADAGDRAPSLSGRIKPKDGQPMAAANSYTPPTNSKIESGVRKSSSEMGKASDSFDDEIPFAAEFR